MAVHIISGLLNYYRPFYRRRLWWCKYCCSVWRRPQLRWFGTSPLR